MGKYFVLINSNTKKVDITSAIFLKGIVGPDVALNNNFPQVAFIGRSNSGKSSIINCLTRQKKLARTSNNPGMTREINMYLINDSCYFLDLPGYGFAKASKETRETLRNIIFGFLFEASYTQKKVVMVIDAKAGPTKLDLEMLELLEEHEKNIVIVANKTDKVKRSQYKKRMDEIKEKVGEHEVIPFSAEKRIGRKELLYAIL